MLANKFPSDVVLVVATDAMADQRLTDREEAWVANAVEKRKREFRGGRNAAKTALKQLGFEGSPILLPVENTKRPDWPSGYVGSICHTAGFCAAAVAHANAYAGIGIDVEPRTALRRGVVSRICTEREQKWICRQPDDEFKPDWGKTIFCIKETIYKVFNPIHEVYLGFQEADVAINSKEKTFVADIHQREHGIQCRYSGRFSMDEHYIYASTILRA
ncbi:4'-phosphopantetheinyl transferase superfamily protein [Congregibacter brevis]|uniref:Enterobactin synthase component D n=1 Tax=Congregibacter brevis TaxID=3081201 RepID=A0ABZ0IB86_9GAMM|nr:4'-phosphopantetheinyl transferase superfamily protein [Congregibacter sp. IMCC45268]